MTPQEQQMIQGLIDRVQKTQLPEKDAEAEQLLQQSLGRNPDALYIMAQSLLVQGYALEQAQKQLPDLKAQLADATAQLNELQQEQNQYQQQPPPPPPQKHTSFLGNIFGAGDDRPAPPPAYPQQGYPQQQSQYAPVANYGQPQAYPPPAYGGPQYGQPAPPQGGGFLRGAMQTAAGVAAGAVAFEGIESLMHGFGHSGGSEGFGGFGGSGGPREEVINNYYGDDAGRGHEGHGLSSDIEDRRDDTRFGDTGDNSGNDDSKDFADTDDSNDDSSSFDDGGSDDSGSDDSSFS